jgi:hypothetical protein
MGPGFIEEDEPRPIDVLRGVEKLFPLRDDTGAFPLGGDQSLFFRE